MSQNTRWVAAIKAEALREAADDLDVEKRHPVSPHDSAAWLRDRADALVKEDDK